MRDVEASRATARASARARILDAAVQLIAHEGINDVRIARIAMQAGVSASLLHYHFASRDSLLQLGVPATYREYPMGHEARPELLRDVVEWLESKVLSPIQLV